MPALAIYSPDQVTSNEPPDLASLGYRFLAEGDSWFSIGSLNPARNSNLLFEMEFQQWAGAVNCASPGDTLRRIAQMSRDPHFVNLLAGRRALPWDALLMSCGGNDLVDAVEPQGADVPQTQRLLLNRDEWGPESDGPQRYFSEPGWQTFSTYLLANLDRVVALRDRGPSQGCPLFLHGYAFLTPRPAGAGRHIGPWLYPSFVSHAVPEGDMIGLAKLLLQRLAALLGSAAADGDRFPSLYFFDTTAIPLVPAVLGATGESGDWVNEIHLTWRGYEKLARPWSAFIEATLARS